MNLEGCMSIVKILEQENHEDRRKLSMSKIFKVGNRVIIELSKMFLPDRRTTQNTYQSHWQK